MRDYVWLVPFVESETEIWLKTIIPSRKTTKKYLESVENLVTLSEAKGLA